MGSRHLHPARCFVEGVLLNLLLTVFPGRGQSRDKFAVKALVAAHSLLL